MRLHQMITGDLKNKVDKLWEMFWTGGLTNPLDVIEQITYLMFIRDLDDMDNTRKQDSVMLGLNYIVTVPQQQENKSESINTNHTRKKREQRSIEGQITFNDF